MFERFSDLPPELKDTIWRNALDSIAPRVIAFEHTRFWNRSNRIPGLLHACQYSRNLSRKRYKWVGSDHAEDGNMWQTFPGLGYYIDYEKDIFLYNPDYHPDINLPPWISTRLFQPARRILLLQTTLSAPLNSSHCCSLLGQAFRRTQQGTLREIFVPSFPGYFWHSSSDDILDLIYKNDFVDIMQRHGTGVLRCCKSKGTLWSIALPEGFWHEDTECCASCPRKFEDLPSIQILDYGQYQQRRQAVEQEAVTDTL